MVHDRIAAGETTVVSTAAVLRCEKQMEKLPHYNFSWTVSVQKICEMLRLEISSRSHSLEISVWKRLWTCRETDKYLTFTVGLGSGDSLSARVISENEISFWNPCYYLYTVFAQ
jgi:hypothetical protein